VIKISINQLASSIKDVYFGITFNLQFKGNYRPKIVLFRNRIWVILKLLDSV
jgi:hypothetical protein